MRIKRKEPLQLITWSVFKKLYIMTSIVFPWTMTYYLSRHFFSNPTFSKTLCEALISTLTKPSNLSISGNSSNTLEITNFTTTVVIPLFQYFGPRA